jgi:hypothetical protein
MSTLDLSYPALLQLFGGYAVNQRTETRQFLAWFLANYYRLEEYEVDDCICDGSDDMGVDGIYVNDQLSQIDVFQSHIVQSNKTLGDALLKKFSGTLGQFENAEKVRTLETNTTNTELAALIDDMEIPKKITEGYEVRGVFLSNAKRDGKATNYLGITKGIILYDGLELQRVYSPINKTPPIATEFSFDVSGVSVMEHKMDKVKMAIAPLNSEELVKMEGISSGELFAWNVRQWLRKTKVNKDIEKSILAPAEHIYFPAFHNGLTVLCNKLEVTKEKISVCGYAVVNGCQSLTGLYDNRTKVSSNLKILTKFIQVAPESTLALKITDHTNNQNGTTGRDLKSNHTIQVRLQTEINATSKYRYRIKRGEHPEWDEDTGLTVIENTLAARILLASDIKEPWTSHQTYKLFEELHSQIFGRPEVTSDRVLAWYENYLMIRGKLSSLTNKLFASYSITPFVLLYLLREALETDDKGKEYCENPARFVQSSDYAARAKKCVDAVAMAVMRIVETFVKRRDEDPSARFDYKRELKSPNQVRSMRDSVISSYQMAADNKFVPRFADEWNNIGKKKKRRRK